MRYRASRINLDEILEELFRCVGETYTEEFCKNSGWYLLHEWTMNEEESFRDWLVGYYRNNGKTTIKEAKRMAEFFILNYGWKRL